NRVVIFFFQAEDGIRDRNVTGVQTCALPIWFAIRPIIYASVLSAGVLLCAFSAHADERDQLKSIQADIAAKERAVRQKQQQRAKIGRASCREREQKRVAERDVNTNGK